MLNETKKIDTLRALNQFDSFHDFLEEWSLYFVKNQTELLNAIKNENDDFSAFEKVFDSKETGTVENNLSKKIRFIILHDSEKIIEGGFVLVSVDGEIKPRFFRMTDSILNFLAA